MKPSLECRTLSCLAAAAIACGPSARAAIILDETFETYSLGDVSGQGGWLDFGGTVTTDVVDTLASTGNHSLRFATAAPFADPNNGYGSDATIDLAAPITSGQLLLTFDVYHPASFDGNLNIFISRGATNAPDFVFEGGYFLYSEGATMTLKGTGITEVPLITDQWVPITINIDLDANTSDAQYGATTIYSGPWIVDGALPSQYQGVDIWANWGTAPGASYIDNFRLELIPEPGTPVLLGLAAGGLFLRRRRS